MQELKLLLIYYLFFHGKAPNSYVGPTGTGIGAHSAYQDPREKHSKRYCLLCQALAALMAPVIPHGIPKFPGLRHQLWHSPVSPRCKRGEAW